MIILGIDPGIATTGFGLIRLDKGVCSLVDCGVITTDKDLAHAERLAILYKDLQGLIREHKPHEIAVEKLFFSSNVTTAMTVGEARGVVLLAGNQAGLVLAEYTPLQVKQGITGYGKATKRQVQEMVRVRLKLPVLPKPDDAADALAVALTHSAHNKTAPAREGGTVE